MPDDGRYEKPDIERRNDKCCKKMLEDGTITLEKIAEFVGLSVDEVRKLKTDQKV